LVVKTVKIAPSMMCADFLHLGRELDLMREEGIDYLHIDIMDGHYVPNFTLGPDFCRALAGYSPIPLDIHLMIEGADAHVPSFAKIPNAVVSIHPEVSYHPIRTLELIKGCGARAGIAIDPAMSLEAVSELLPHVSFACLMTVNPGYAGQKLVPNTIRKIRVLSDLIARRRLDVEIEVDGNVSWENIPRMVEAGAEVLVAGSSSLFAKGTTLRENIRRMRRMIGREG
jgi:ribulose-phosphate 3-epimerase